jgi:hypothetical protein
MENKIILRPFIAILTILLLAGAAYAGDIKYQGKVIDADTLKPIEGAVVVFIWLESKARFPEGSDQRFKDAREAITDKKGDWTIVGPEDEMDKMFEPISLLFNKYYTQSPEIVIYKPGYVKYPRPSGIYGGFAASPYIDKRGNIEGIVLNRYGDTKSEHDAYFKELRKHSVGMAPLIPMKNPVKQLKELNFNFEYPENVKWVGVSKSANIAENYRVDGIRKVKTREERGKSLPGGFTFLEALNTGKLPKLAELLRGNK